MKSVFTFFMIAVCSVCSAQIDVLSVNKTPKILVGKIRNGFTFVADMEKQVSNKDTIYTLSFQDARFTAITRIESLDFNSDGDAFNTFYSICKSVFHEDNKKNKDYSVTFNLGGETIMVSNARMMGNTYVRIFKNNSYSIQLLESQIDKLFGKN